MQESSIPDRIQAAGLPGPRKNLTRVISALLPSPLPRINRSESRSDVHAHDLLHVRTCLTELSLVYY